MATNLVIFSAALTGAFQPSNPLALYEDNEYVVLDFKLTFTVAGTLEWYLEFAKDNPNDVVTPTDWFRETAQESAAGGVVSMPQVLRTLQAQGGGNFGIGTHVSSVQLVRKHKYVRAQVRVAGGGTGSLILSTPFGIPTT